MAVLRTLRAQCESEAKVLAFVFSVIAPVLKVLATLGYFVGAAVVISLLLGAVLPSKGIFHSAQGTVIAEDYKPHNGERWLVRDSALGNKHVAYLVGGHDYLVVLLLFFLAVALLVRSMNKHLRRVPKSFDDETGSETRE